MINKKISQKEIQSLLKSSTSNSMKPGLHINIDEIQNISKSFDKKKPKKVVEPVEDKKEHLGEQSVEQLVEQSVEQSVEQPVKETSKKTKKSKNKIVEQTLTKSGKSQASSLKPQASR